MSTICEQIRAFDARMSKLKLAERLNIALKIGACLQQNVCCLKSRIRRSLSKSLKCPRWPFLSEIGGIKRCGAAFRPWRAISRRGQLLGRSEARPGGEKHKRVCIVWIALTLNIRFRFYLSSALRARRKHSCDGSEPSPGKSALWRRFPCENPTRSAEFYSAIRTLRTLDRRAGAMQQVFAIDALSACRLPASNPTRVRTPRFANRRRGDYSRSATLRLVKAFLRPQLISQIIFLARLLANSPATLIMHICPWSWIAIFRIESVFWRRTKLLYI